MDKNRNIMNFLLRSAISEKLLPDLISNIFKVPHSEIGNVMTENLGYKPINYSYRKGNKPFSTYIGIYIDDSKIADIKSESQVAMILSSHVNIDVVIPLPAELLNIYSSNSWLLITPSLNRFVVTESIDDDDDFMIDENRASMIIIDT